MTILRCDHCQKDICETIFASPVTLTGTPINEVERSRINLILDRHFHAGCFVEWVKSNADSIIKHQLDHNTLPKK